MCIIAVKNGGFEMPSKETLETCFENNPDGAGYMFNYENKVYIYKGFMDFDSFYKDLMDSYELTGKDSTYVMHFRISTEGGVSQELCHPYPLNKDIKELRKLQYVSSVGIAHNGTIDLTKSYGVANRESNDSMRFITQYIAKIIHDPKYYNNVDSVGLIKELIEYCSSRLAILSNDGHCELFGNGWVDDEQGIHYSNEYFKKARVRASKAKTGTSSTVENTDSSYWYPSYYWYSDDDYWDYPYSYSKKKVEEKTETIKDAIIVSKEDDTNVKEAEIKSGDQQIIQSKIPASEDEYFEQLFYKYANSFDSYDGKYHFDPQGVCPYMEEDTTAYCEMCVNKDNCLM